MRIIGGEWRGRKIEEPRGRDVTRPTTDRVREACASVGGEGGGHRIAAGGSVPEDMVDQFLRNLDDILGRQLAEGRKD